MSSILDNPSSTICTCGQGGSFGKYDCGCFDDEVIEDRILQDSERALEIISKEVVGMTPEDQRIAIAKFCGVDIDHLRLPAPVESLRDYIYFRRSQAGPLVIETGEPCINLDWLPNYLGDKNAILDALMSLDEVMLREFERHLRVIMNGRSLVLATAKEESEALLKVINAARSAAREASGSGNAKCGGTE